MKKNIAIVTVAVLLATLAAWATIRHLPPPKATATLSPTPSTPTGTIGPVTPTATSSPPSLHVVGQALLNGLGKPVTLIGATRPSLEYNCHGDGHQTLADFQVMRTWGMTAVRLSVSSGFWANVGGTCPDYHATMAGVIHNAEQAGLYVIIDLQWAAPLSLPLDAQKGGAQCPLPAQSDVAFWQQVGTIYANDPRVLFELLSEPYNITAEQWYHGMTVTSDCSRYSSPITYQGVGMLDLVNEVRAIAPDTVLLVSGFNWGYDLSGVTSQYPFPMHNLMFNTHPFDHKTAQEPNDWQRAFGNAVNAGYPVIISEFGAYDCGTGYVSQVIAYAEAHHLSWLTWAWDNWGCAGPALITNYDGTPSVPYGSYIRSQMIAASQQ